MPDYVFLNQGAATAGFTTSTYFAGSGLSTSVITDTVGTVSIGNLSDPTSAVKGFPSKRPVIGQVYPRGVYNK